MNSSNAFLDLVEEVAEDGELTYEEIRSLAKWLNENKTGRGDWPANEFYPLLKSAFADGKIERSEAQAIGKLIQKVLREWARQKAEDVSLTNESVVKSAIADFDDTQPKLPSIPIKLLVASLKDEDMTYEVDFSGPTCSCPDFKSRRSQFSEGSIPRCCKHIMQGYSELRPAIGWPSWLEPFLETGFRPLPSQKWAVLRCEYFTALVSSASPEWGNVYMLVDGESCKYGYSIDDERWSYGTAPKLANEFVKLIRRLTDT